MRPDDSRYGDNPNRVQQHTQFQVFLQLIILVCVHGVTLSSGINFENNFFFDNNVFQHTVLMVFYLYKQVILKPDPGNSQELYLGSLAALGMYEHTSRT